jgi:anti-sigma factor RsiW
MTHDIHEQAKSAVRTSIVENRDREAWLEAHLEECAACAAYDRQLRDAIREVRRTTLAPSVSLVERTKARVHLRARDMEARRRQLQPVWIACVFSVIWTVLTMPLVWRGVEWLTARAGVRQWVAEAGFLLGWLVPGVGAAIVLWLYARRRGIERLEWAGDQQ